MSEKQENETEQRESDSSSSGSGAELTPTHLQEWESADEDDMPLDRVSIMDLLDPFVVSTQFRKRLNHTVKRESERLKIRMGKLQQDAGNMDLEKLKDQIVNQVDKLEHRMSSEQVISLGEKLTFSFSVLNIFLIGYMIGACPEKFHWLYTIESFILLPYRWFTYKKKGFHYFMADLCYFVNFLLLVFIWVFPESTILYVSCFAFTYGTLCWAVITWRNSLVLHSIDKTTSTFIHILPPTLCHVFTHVLTDEHKRHRFPGAMHQESWQMAYTTLWTSVLYFIWQSAYHYFITHRRKEKIKQGRVTSFNYLRKSYGETKLGHWVNSLPEQWAIVAFTGIQFSFQLSTMMLCPLWFKTRILSTGFLTCVMFVACYNGATYYLEIFGKRFQKELMQLQEEVAAYRAEAPYKTPYPNQETTETNKEK